MRNGNYYDNGTEGRNDSGIGDIKSILQPYLPEISRQLMLAVKPIARDAAKYIKPAVKDALKDYAPTAIAIAAALFGLGILTSLYIVKKWCIEGD